MAANENTVGRSRAGMRRTPADRGLDWARDGQDWPNGAASRFVEAAGLAWHVQIMGRGPVLLLIHGTGASTHSWRDLAPDLARDFTVVAPDLPGHAFTAMPSPARMTLPGMASALAALCDTLAIVPHLVAGHSAGAAILAHLCLDGRLAPRGLVGLNAALRPIGGMAGQLFSPLAKVLARSPLVPWFFARQARDPATVVRLIGQTGSRLDTTGLALYARLVREESHAAAALAMMAHWDLDRLGRDLPRLPVPLLLVVGMGDKAVPPEDAVAVAARVPGTRIERLRGLGHLAHEERPAEVAGLIRRQAAAWDRGARKLG